MPFYLDGMDPRLNDESVGGGGTNIACTCISYFKCHFYIQYTYCKFLCRGMVPGTRMYSLCVHSGTFPPTHPSTFHDRAPIPPFVNPTAPHTPPSSYCFVSPVPPPLFCGQYNSPKQSNKLGHAPLSYASQVLG